MKKYITIFIHDVMQEVEINAHIDNKKIYSDSTGHKISWKNILEKHAIETSLYKWKDLMQQKHPEIEISIFSAN